MENLTFTSTGIPVARRGEFPAEFRRGFIGSLDRGFLKVFAICFGVIVPLFIIGALQSPPTEISADEMEKIQERYARLVLNQTPPKKEKKKAKTDDAAAKAAAEEAARKEAEKKEAEKKKAEETVTEKKERKEATSAERLVKREAMKKQLENIGLFAELTAGVSSARGSGREVRDLIGDMDAASSLSGMSLSGESFVQRKGDDAGAIVRERRGERSEGGTIGTSGLAAASAGTLKSAGTVELSDVSNVEGEAASDASRDMKALSQVLMRYQPRLKKVFEDFLKRNPDLKGQMTVRFTIEADGTISNLLVLKSDIGDDEFEKMILRHVQRIKFSPASGKVTIEWPLSFSAS